MTKTSPGIIITCMTIAIAAIVYASAPDTHQGQDTVEKQLLAEARQTNELLTKIHEALADMNIEEKHAATVEQLETMNSYLKSIDDKVDEDSETLKQINSNINNSRNPVCILEQLEDIKSALNRR